MLRCLGHRSGIEITPYEVYKTRSAGFYESGCGPVDYRASCCGNDNDGDETGNCDGNDERGFDHGPRLDNKDGLNNPDILHL
jgi:hypothetical protein